MIITRPMGGMGNQMYALALGKSLALRLGQPLAIDKSWVRADSRQRGLDRDALQHFDHGVPEWTLSRSPVGRMLLSNPMDRIFWHAQAQQALDRRWVLVEKTCCFEPGLLDIDRPDIYLRGGTWQSYRYFQDQAEAIRAMFTFRERVILENRDWAEQIAAAGQAVAMHVRRGDYVSSPSAAYTQGICTPGYYQKALAWMRQHLEKPVFFFFSDDMAWVRQTFGTQADHVYVERRASHAAEIGYRDDGHNDMHCMSLCRHAIIANSTFSWWAAWLNANPGKLVVAPGTWYQGVDDDSFIVPPEWMRIHG